MARKNVPASTVREWARKNADLIPEGARAGLGETARGRIHPDITAAFKKANKGLTYEPKVAEKPTITVRVPFTDKRGRISRAALVEALAAANA